MRLLRRVFLVFPAFGLFPIATFLARMTAFSQHAARMRVMRLSQRLNRFLCWAMGLHVDMRGFDELGFTGKDGLLILANHVSYLDVLMINAVVPATFVTSCEVEETPVLGHITRAAGCIHVERRRKTAVLRDIEQITTLLNQGYNVVLFPEGSTSNGETFLEFKKTLLESAMRSRSRVLPLCVRYERVDGEPFGPANRDQVAWYGDMSFFPHFIKVLGLRAIEARLTALEPLSFRSHRSRKRLADDAKARIAETYFA